MNDDLKIVEPCDWRYSAAIVGLVRYLKWLERERNIEYRLTEERLEYHQGDINKQDYLRFVEQEYLDDMHHLVVEEKIKINEWVDTDKARTIKEINDKLAANTILKNIFKKVKYDGTNAEIIQCLIEEHREEIVRETFRHKSNLYSNYCNTNQLFEEQKECCRLLGYYVDMPKKGKSISYNFNISSFVGKDEQIFDFIPFAFEGERDFFFINDNFDLRKMISTNQLLRNVLREERKTAKEENKIVDARQVFFKLLIESKDFIRNDIEVITKNIENKYFETLYLRMNSLNILNSLKTDSSNLNRYQCFRLKIKITDQYYIDVYKIVIESIINLVLLDNLINYLLKNNEKNSYTYVISQLIWLNTKIKGGEKMDKAMSRAYACARSIVDKREGGSYKVADNKLSAYNKKLTSALTFEDYDRFCQILLNLANYADQSLDFAYDLFEDFEKNKEVAYTFVNALRRN